MNVKLIVTAIFSLFLFSACEVQMGPSEYWRQVFGTDSDSQYYRKISKKLVKQITKSAKKFDINKIAVIDIVDDKGKVPKLGSFMTSKVVEQVARGNRFRVAQKGEVLEVLSNMNLAPAPMFSREESRQIGKALHSQALITGKLTDIGTNIDVHLTMVDVVTGEVIVSATEGMVRTRFAVEMLRNY